KWGVQIPLNYNVGATQITPEYDPFYQDLLLKDRIATATTQSQRDTIRNQAIDYTERKSISLIGVRKNGSGAKPHFYNVENFDFSYAYNEFTHHDYEIQSQSNKTVALSANYNYGFSPLEINPFKKIKALNRKKYWQWLREVNFNLMPNNIAISSNINRLFNSQQFREVYSQDIDASQQLALPDLQQRNFLFDWTYSINHNLSRSLKMNFTASSNNIVRNYYQENNQGASMVDKSRDIWDGLWDVGDPNRHFQSLTLNYKLPLKYIPFLSFIDANYSYTGDFSWQRGSNALADVQDIDGNVLGIVNSVQNANTQTLNGSISMSKIYRLFGIQNREQKLRKILPSKNTLTTAEETKKVPKKKKRMLRSIVDVLSVMKRIQFTYTENNGKVLPGYLPSLGFGGTLQPTPGFTFGSQADVRYEAARNGWLTDFPDFNQQFTQVHNNQLKVSGQFDFGKGLLIDFTAERNFSENLSENFSVINGSYVPLNPNTYGNFGISTLLIKTAFNTPPGSYNPNFEKFREHRLVVAQRLATAAGIPAADVDEEGFPRGFGRTSQTVIIPSFLAAYSGTSAERISLEPIKKTPLPNWSLKYTGLMDIKSLKKIFNRFSLTHAYRSSYTINNFQSNLDYDPAIPNQLDDGGNFIPVTLFSNLNLVEQFNPLLRVDLELKNSFKFLAELKTDRALSLSLDNNLLTESRGQEYIVGMGYRIKDLRIRTRVGGKRTTLSGDLNIKADLSYRNNITVLRNLEIDNNQVTAGQTLWSIKLTADYALSKNLTSQFFYDHNFSEFAISSAFPQTSIRSGISIRYNFGN
ncbi:MAG: cell surface protein SprA, partial [Candidatus Arcticimaribacter sp.]